MSTISIDGQQRSLSDAIPQWIHDQIDPRSRDGKRSCVQVSIHTTEVDLALTTPTCQVAGSGGGRRPNAREAEIFRIWEQQKLNTSEFSVGNVIAFVKQVLNLL